ncbi:MAG: hypothetical protein Kow0032_14010 [Methyloligellaceae bacterium]
MRALAAFLMLPWLAHVTPAQAESGRPTDAVIIATAQLFVLEHFKRSPERHFSIAFDIANIHPQPEKDYWAVIGAFMADAGNKNYLPHGYGVAMRLICADYEKLSCWQLEKLVIDQTVILNN